MRTRDAVLIALAASFMGLSRIQYAIGADNKDVQKSMQEISERADRQTDKDKDRFKKEVNEKLDKFDDRLKEFRKQLKARVDSADRASWNETSAAVEYSLAELNQSLDKAISAVPQSKPAR